MSTGTTEYQRRPRLDLQVHGDRVSFEIDGERFERSDQVLPILAAFAQPVALQHALDVLCSAGTMAWMQTSALVMDMIDIGALVTNTPGRLNTPQKGTFALPHQHIRMLDDEPRTNAYRDAIASVVGNTDIVLDIGTGSGVLACLAAQAGARHVYAVEATSMADLAVATFRRNGYGDRITLIRGYSTRIELPQRATVLVSELIGNDPFGENTLEYIRDARRRLTQPDARVIPQSVDLFMVGVALPEQDLDAMRYSERHVARWQKAYDIDFGELANTPFSRCLAKRVEAAETKKWNKTSAPQRIIRQNLSDPQQIMLEASATLELSAPTHGLLSWFDLALTPDFGLSTAPSAPGRARSWRNILWLPTTAEIAPGRYTICYSYDPGRGPLINIIPAQ